MLLEIFFENFHLDDCGIFSLAFPASTNLKLHGIPVIPKIVKKATTNSHYSVACGSEYIVVLFQKNCEPELSYIVDYLFNIFERESLLSDCWKVLFMDPVFENVKETSVVENCRPVIHLSIISKIFDKPLNNRCIDHLRKYACFS